MATCEAVSWITARAEESPGTDGAQVRESREEIVNVLEKAEAILPQRWILRVDENGVEVGVDGRSEARQAPEGRRARDRAAPSWASSGSRPSFDRMLRQRLAPASRL